MSRGDKMEGPRSHQESSIGVDRYVDPNLYLLRNVEKSSVMLYILQCTRSLARASTQSNLYRLQLFRYIVNVMILVISYPIKLPSQ